MYKNLILLLTLISPIFGNLECSDIENLSSQQLWDVIQQTQFQKIFNLVIGSLSIIILLITIASWKIYPTFTIPADIMFSIAICQLIQNTSMVASSAYLTDHSNKQIPVNFDQSCTALGVFLVIGNFGSLIYNLLFCLVLSFSMRRTLKGSLFSQKIYHIFAFVSTVSTVLALALSNNIGRGINGLCGYRITGRQNIAKFIVQLIIVAGCILSLIMFKRKIPKNTYFQKVSVFGYYYYYIGIFSLIQIINTTAYMIGNIACRSGLDYSSDIIRISLIFGNSFSFLLSFVLFFLRFSHPILQIKLRKKFDKNYDSSLEDQHFDPDQDPWLGCLLQSIKGSQIISFISGILISFAEHQYKIPKNASSTNLLLYKKNYITYLNEDITDQYVLRRINSRQSYLIQQKLLGLRSLQYQVTIYSIGLFAKLISEQLNLNVFKSFNINQNIPLIKKSSNINGGKSGEFFFKTYDQRFIIKTIREDQAMVYLAKISDFYTYFESNPHTLIAKILGLYKFYRKDVNQPSIYLIIMKNLSPVPTHHYLRVYDIKGSQFNRSTITQKQINDTKKLRGITLKDLDFHKIQGRVAISQQLTIKLKNQLKKDAQFLGNMGVIDYSVLIIKRRGPRIAGEESKQFLSILQDDIIYNMGIIDYLQSWTFKRKAQRAFKMMITRKKVTVNSPTAYQQRFTENLDRIF